MPSLAWLARAVSLVVIAGCLIEIAGFAALGLPFSAAWPLLLALVANVAFLATRASIAARAQAAARVPDYAMIAALEREIYGRAFRHAGAPEAARARLAVRNG